MPLSGQQSNPAKSNGMERPSRTGIIAACPLLGLFTTNERSWSTCLVTVIVPIPIFLMGFTFAFASSAILDLSGEATELPPDYILSTYLVSIFVVSSKPRILTPVINSVLSCVDIKPAVRNGFSMLCCVVIIL